MRKLWGLFISCLLVVVLYACSDEEATTTKSLTVEQQIEAIISKMTLREKAGQMVQAERAHITPQEVRDYNIGSVLSGGGSNPSPNTPLSWFMMVKSYQEAALESSTGIPILYGVDAVHGHNNVYGATLFPHNIGLGAANDPELMKKIGQATGVEMRITGVHWNFAPSVAVGQDARWGRYYESFGEHPDIHKQLVKPYIEGLQSEGISANAKHFIADGGTVWNEDNHQDVSWALDNPDAYKMDQGDAPIDEQTMRTIHLPGYIEAIEADVDTIMISYSSLNGVKMHEHPYIESILKEELGFEGIVISDYNAIQQLSGNYTEQVSKAVSAGIDMLMEPSRWKETIEAIVSGVNQGKISKERVDEAVRRILTIKFKRGLMDDPLGSFSSSNFYHEDHRQIAREAVQKSQVLLKNNEVLPLAKDSHILLLGPGADHLGMQSGGWTIEWQGTMNKQAVKGVSILEGLQQVAEEHGGKIYTDIKDASKASIQLVVIGEIPYAEYVGDNGQLTLDSVTMHPDNLLALEQAKSTGLPTIVILLSGRPLLVTDYIDDWDGLIAAWLPGSEAGLGLADTIYGEVDFTGRLPITWPKDASQFGDTVNQVNYNPDDYLFPYGYGLSYGEAR